MTSPDGINWTSRTAPSTTVQWQDVCWSPELKLFVAVGTVGTGTNSRMMTSPDGITWTLRKPALNPDFSGICWSPELGMFCTVAITGTGNRIMNSLRTK
jgi:hypothetical protein